MKLALKSNVNLAGLQPQMTVALLAVIGQIEALDPTCTEVMITSANDSVHGTNSLHSRDKICRALDFRTHNLFTGRVNYRQQLLLQLASELRAALPGFDVILESFGLPNEHLHVEWDPKPAPKTTTA